MQTCRKLKKKVIDVTIYRHGNITLFFFVFFDADLFLSSSLATGLRFMSISWLVLELWQILFIKNWTEVLELGILPSEFRPISGDWGKLEIPNLALIFLIKSYWILQNAIVTALTISELLRENQQGRRIKWHLLRNLENIRNISKLHKIIG